jgi:diketogulonate reductase-like aldo/keto reductase
MQVLLAFVMAQDQVIAIPRSGNPDHVRENLAAGEIILTAEEQKLLNDAFPPPRGPMPLDIV